MIDPSAAVRQGLVGLSRRDGLRRLVGRTPVGRSAARRLVAGQTTEDCVGAVAALVADGRLASVEHIGRPAVDAAQASRTRDGYLALIRTLKEHDLTAHGAAELSLDLSVLGVRLADDGAKIALDNARQLCEAAAAAGATVSIDAADHPASGVALGIVHDLRADFPWVGAVLHAQLRRTEADCRELATKGSRVRLSGDIRRVPESVGFRDRHDVDLSYVRCLKILLEGAGHPIIAGHDTRLTEIACSLADKELRSVESFEFQLDYGVRPDLEQSLVEAGYRVRIHVPYGEDWHSYVMRRIAEHPADTRFLLRSGPTKG